MDAPRIGRAVEPSVAHVFVADLDEPVAEDADLHHLTRVLRVRAGEALTVGDGQGRWRRCRFDGRRGLVVEGPVRSVPAPQPRVTVGFSVIKGDRTEWALQKLVEVGVDRVVLLTTARTVVRWEGDKLAREQVRLRRIAREAAMQSRRAWLADVAGPMPFDQALASSVTRDRPEATDDPTGMSTGRERVAVLPAGVALAHPGGSPIGPAHQEILVGPEGGWAPEELALGLPIVGLGPTNLRTETAAVVAGTLATALRAGLVRPSLPV
jgi:16S rRNA (uracil1498-N3)-methyltransferase